MPSTTITILLFAVLFAITIGSMDAYRLDDDHEHMNDMDENNELNDPYFIQRLQALLAAATNGGSTPKRSSSADHNINTRLAMNRRPGLIRLKKNV